MLYPGDINLVLTTLNIFEMQIDDGVANNEDYGKHLMLWFQAALLFAVVWGIGGILDTESRKKFDVFYKEVSSNFLLHLLHRSHPNQCINFL